MSQKFGHNVSFSKKHEKFVFVDGDRGGGERFPGVGEEVFC